MIELSVMHFFDIWKFMILYDFSRKFFVLAKFMARDYLLNTTLDDGSVQVGEWICARRLDIWS